MAIHCPRLRVLSVSVCNITDLGLRALAGSLSSSAAAALLSRSASSGHGTLASAGLNGRGPAILNGNAHAQQAALVSSQVIILIHARCCSRSFLLFTSTIL
ncbi:unnamed protein product [Protopolystoma xenopodis]|uniref:Uncharacterized protein n=1 Tax=Protopolystoma xenopodis TaxID=117903 RepID=A0A448WHN5_9PLAT|nr:unnamed protein product [Protopolystoma xenopodis]